MWDVCLYIFCFYLLSFPTSLPIQFDVLVLFLKDKTHTHTHMQTENGIWLVLANYSSAWGLPCSVIDTPCQLIAENWLPSLNKYQLQTASLVLGGNLFLLPFVPAGVLTVVSPCMSCIHCHSLCEFVCSFVLSCPDYNISMNSSITAGF